MCVCFFFFSDIEQQNYKVCLKEAEGEGGQMKSSLRTTFLFFASGN